MLPAWTRRGAGRGVAATAVIAGIMAHASTAAAADCAVEAAARAALERELALIEDMSVDVEATFTGPSGCVASALFEDLDLSNLIPDLSGFMTSLGEDLVDNAIQAARDQACRAVSDAVADLVGTANDTVTTFNASLNPDLGAILEDGWSFP